MFYACEYNPTSEFFREVDREVDLPEVTIDLNIPNDTLVLYSPSNISFDFNVPGKKVRWIRLYINNVEIKAFDENSHIFPISDISGMFDNGVHSMRVEAMIGSGAGSVADEFGAEGFLLTNKWVLIIDKNREEGGVMGLRERRSVRMICGVLLVLGMAVLRVSAETTPTVTAKAAVRRLRVAPRPRLAAGVMVSVSRSCISRPDGRALLITSPGGYR